jgi:hypothetical protein
MISPPPSRTTIISFLADIFNKLGITQRAEIDANWLEFFSDVYFGIKYTQTSGTTAQRPIKDLFPGRFYFDTSLGANGKPIYIAKDGVTWITADGLPA